MAPLGDHSGSDSLYHTDSQDLYSLPNDGREGKRLNLKYHIVKTARALVISDHACNMRGLDRYKPIYLSVGLRHEECDELVAQLHEETLSGSFHVFWRYYNRHPRVRSPSH
ncbi:hypothetical protein DL93DRAFT_2157224 [Clavulina sp. PMI_390]|nr:hypothetical protein DL93DRAFT_2157224 [Clavulina sp. PMI_390]